MLVSVFLFLFTDSLYQGDMKLNEVQKELLNKQNLNITSRAIITSKVRRFWSRKDSNNNIVVPYVYHSSICKNLYCYKSYIFQPEKSN